MKEKKLNKIFNKDSRDIIRVLSKEPKIMSTITSPPYFDMKDYGSENQIGFGQTYEKYLLDLKKVFTDIFQITLENGSLWIIIDTFKRDNQVITLPFDLSSILKEIGWLLQDVIIWKKDKTVPWSSNGFVQRNFEYILYLTKRPTFKYNKDKVRNFDTSKLKKWWVKYPERYNPKGKAIGEIWEFPIPVQGSWGKKYVRHFCPLPKEMVATMIDLSTDEGDIILDPFSGSGAVPFQASVMKRNYIGFELNKSYIDMFESYLSINKLEGIEEYESLKTNDNQTLFEDRILKLRALKFGRVLINQIRKELKLDLKVVVKIKNFERKNNFLISVDYNLIGKAINQEILSSKINEISSKPPLSKYGINPFFTFSESLNLQRLKKIYCYTKSNSYSYSNLEPESPNVTVISDIMVNLNENDYS